MSAWQDSVMFYSNSDVTVQVASHHIAAEGSCTPHCNAFCRHSTAGAAQQRHSTANTAQPRRSTAGTAQQRHSTAEAQHSRHSTAGTAQQRHSTAEAQHSRHSTAEAQHTNLHSTAGTGHQSAQHSRHSTAGTAQQAQYSRHGTAGTAYQLAQPAPVHPQGSAACVHQHWSARLPCLDPHQQPHHSPPVQSPTLSFACQNLTIHCDNHWEASLLWSG